MVPDREQIEKQLSRILGNPRFAASPRMSELLAYLVKAALEGDDGRLKGAAIGVEVFGRPPDFDPSSDSIVRVQTGRLRRLLENYYLTDGAHDPVRLDIPKGQYKPEFRLREGFATAPESGPDPASAAPPQGRPALPERFRLGVVTAVVLLAAVLGYAVFMPDRAPQRAGDGQPGQAGRTSEEAITLAILPLRTSETDATARFVADGITSELVSTLARIPAFEISSPAAAASAAGGASVDLRRIGRELNADYVLEGSLQHMGAEFRVQVQLLRAETRKTVWADAYEGRDDSVFDIQDEIVLALASELRPQIVTAAKEAMSAKPTDRQSAWELYMQATWTPGYAVNSQEWQAERIDLARRALELRPDFGPAHSVMADKMVYLANMVPRFDTPERRAVAAGHARRAIELSPQDPDAMFNIAIHHWHMGDLQESRRFLERVLELDASHPLARFLVYMVPHTCRAVPQPLIERLANYDASLSPDNPVRWVSLTWLALAHLNNGDYDTAIEFAREANQIHRTPDTTYRFAAALVQAGQGEEAGKLHAEQKQSWSGLDAHHYAGETIGGRLCAGEPLEEQIKRVYHQMAETVEPPV